MKNGHLNVMYSADENYAPFLGVSLFSLLENNKEIENITIYAVLDRVSPSNRDKLISMVDSYGRELIIVEATDLNEIFKKNDIPQYRGSYAANYRTMFHIIVKDNVERLLYIDSDTIITGDLSALIDLDTEGCCACVVRDAIGGKYKLLLGLEPSDLYFNSGVILFDVINWKTEKCTNIILNHIKNERVKYCNPDQDLLNITLKGKLKILPCNYNFMPIHRAYSDEDYEKYYGFNNYYTPKEIDDARKNPVIVHTYRFLGEFPWNKNNYHPDTKLFDEYLAQSPWKDYVKKTANMSCVLKIEKIMYKIMPHGIFLAIFSKAMYYSFKRQNKNYLRG